ncbi:uncharacterized protein LOC115198113 isoform X2 [Salmo trutta]|uniref:uncharacterized protein LOC115198113 isoform X2 n=1 Tax=Salmo trutta TaxID=8032 RepID=UPI00113070D8|nr:uncharacterized protein LOC115198113 isoform X2 [Salmo trutta]
MKHLLVWLLLSSLCSLSSWGISGTLVVIQSPHNVTVTEGDTVQIQCCWNTNVSRATVNLHKEGHTEIKYNSLLVNNKQCHDRASQQTVACNCSHWTISNLTRNDTGTYICKVTMEIPSLIESVGNGTRITVTSQNTTNNESLPQLSVMIPLTVLPLFLIALICLYMAWKRHQGGAPDGAARVIHEAPNHEDEELKMEELEEATKQSSSSSSRGSTQWCQVQVYESLDYLALPTQDKG